MSTIRLATEQDAEKLVELYAPYVIHTAITFEYTVPTAQEFARRISHVLEKYPYLVAEQRGEIVGYAYAGTFNERAACDWSVEASVYIRQGCTKMGLGRQLYDALEEALAMQNIVNVNACIAVPEAEDEYLTNNSVQFHAHMGYQMVGKFHKCGNKFGRWYHLVWMEKQIGAHREHPPAVKPLEEIREQLDKRLAQRDGK